MNPAGDRDHPPHRPAHPDARLMWTSNTVMKIEIRVTGRPGNPVCARTHHRSAVRAAARFPRSLESPVPSAGPPGDKSRIRICGTTRSGSRGRKANTPIDNSISGQPMMSQSSSNRKNRLTVNRDQTELAPLGM